MKTLSLDSLAGVTGGAQWTRCPNGGLKKIPNSDVPAGAQDLTGGLSHADQLKRGNGGIVPKLPPLSHEQQLKNGNGGIVPKF